MSSFGCRNRALARLMRMRQPPENCTTGRSMEKRSSSGFPFVKPRPQRIFLTRASADSAPVASKSAATFSRSFLVFSRTSADTSCPASIALSNSSSCRSRSSSCFNKSAVRWSAANTSSTADLSLALASCSTRITSQFSGTGKSLDAMCLNMVVLPMPFGPRMPYLLPCTIVIDALLKSVCPGAASVKFSHVNASPDGGGSLFPSNDRVNADKGLINSSASGLYFGWFSKCLSWIFFSRVVNFSPRSTFSNTAWIFSSTVES
mmetsp:Transcript_28895/g.83737  ORF Transcript_28895/g.83737 Transcript_28895/m.83737 type:complete len:262 (+) Transcript_28895:3504-4289(+)